MTRDGESAELAFAVLVERHSAGVLRICKAIAGNESDAEDSFQATFLVLATKASRLTVRETLAPWLASVARRVTRRARAAALARAARELRAARLAEARAKPIDASEDDASVLHEEIDRLPERYRLPLLLCDLECQSHQEAAQTLGWPLGTVKSRQARGRQRLRASLSRRGLSGSLPVGLGFKSIRSFVPDSLIHATARAAVRSVSPSAAAQAVSASVSSLVTNTLRAMIMTRLSNLAGVLLALSVGVAATVVGQTYADPTKRSGNSATAQPGIEHSCTWCRAPVFEYEIQHLEGLTPVTPTMKMRAHPGETSALKIPEGTVELSFKPSTAPTPAAAQPGTPAVGVTKDPLALATLAQLQALDNAALGVLLDRNRNTSVNQTPEALLGTALKQVGVDRNGGSSSDPAALLGIAQKQPGAESKDHELRLAEIERKLERILSNSRSEVPQKNPGENPARNQ